jgi:hypothetical protein
METIENSLESYEPPTVEDVPLKPEEIMLAPCKGNTISAGFSTGVTCINTLTGGPCRTS